MKATRLTADALIVEGKEILLIKRKNPPFKGRWALPGGFVDYNERTDDAASREAKEETGLEVEPMRLVGVYSDPNRDPRGHTVSIAYLCKAAKGQAEAGDDAEDVWWWPLDDLPELAFDHARIIGDYKRSD